MSRRAKKIFYNTVIICLLVAAVGYVCSRFMHPGRVEFTDNAQVWRHITPVNTRISGFIKEIRFEEYQPVKKGDTLLIIEDSEFRLHLAQAEADLSNALAGESAARMSIATTQNNLSVNDAAIEEAKVQMDNASKELSRYEKLYSQDAVTLSQAAVDLAELNLSYTVIIAPCDGFTGHKDIHEGQLVQPGQSMVDIVDGSDVWVIANYRETQLKHISEGAEAIVKADAVPGVKYHGVVESISDATGAAFSLIPQDNATGNFVKVEQRVPVRIRLDGSAEDLAKLRAGFNVECEVKY